MKSTDANLMREVNVELQQQLAEKEKQQQEQEDKINKLKEFICVSSRPQSSTFAAKVRKGLFSVFTCSDHSTWSNAEMDA